jgi:UDPglucose 6-dehydrogenase
MKICVFGLWHLGSVTAACLAEAGFTTIGLEEDAAQTAALSQGRAPLFEPGLEELLRSGLAAGKLTFTSDKRVAADCDVVWITFDTPTDDEDRGDTAFVVDRICTLFPYFRDGTVVLISSQLPVGTVAEVERAFAVAADRRRVAFACSPENLRLGHAIAAFRRPERVVIGSRGGFERPILTGLFAPFCSNIIWVGTEAAELTKHALNAFLATCVTFINEIAGLSEKVGADAREVERALRSEPRIGQKAYIRPGAAFAGGTLARDVAFLTEIAQRNGLPLDMIGSILKSNGFNRGWPSRKLKEKLGNVAGRKVAVLGLSYKPGTDAIRRSLAFELGNSLCAAGATVTAYDPAVKALPGAPKNFTLAPGMAEALSRADALVVMTEWPDFKALKADEIVARMAAPNVVDQNGFLDHLAADPRIAYLTIGKPQ